MTRTASDPPEAPLPDSGDYLIQDGNRSAFHVNRREFESCPVGRIEEPSYGPLLARPDKMPVLRHHSNRWSPHFGRTPTWLGMDPSFQGIVSLENPARITRMSDSSTDGLRSPIAAQIGSGDPG